MYRMVKNGLLTRISASSLSGFAGKKIKKFFCTKLVEAILVHFIAFESRYEKRQKLSILHAYEEIEKQHGKFIVNQLKKSEMLIHGEVIFPRIPS